jgi:outer membrane protein TolC
MVDHGALGTRLRISVSLRHLRGPFVAVLAVVWSSGTSPLIAEEPAPAALTLTLEECLYLALQKQPALTAERASLAAAEDGRRALENLHVPVFIARELPIRRHQASLGVTAAAAGVERAGRDTVYAVTRTYFTVLYARQQEQVARGVVERLSSVHDFAARMLKGGAREVTNTDVERTAVYMDLADVKRIQATKGVERALAALKEAIGLEPCATLQVPAERLPEPSDRPNRKEIICWALARRADLIQANLFTELTGLEVEAQSTSLNHKMDTFAQGGDIHSSQVPQGIANTDYRPAAIPPEMPIGLVGSCTDRVAHAQSLNGRAVAVADKTRHLIALEAENAYLQWEEAMEQAAKALSATTAAEKMADELRKDFVGGLKVKVDDVTTAQVLAAQARSQYNEYLYHQILALADLQRVTAGAFCPGLAGPPRPPLHGVPKEDGGQEKGPKLGMR